MSDLEHLRCAEFAALMSECDEQGSDVELLDRIEQHLAQCDRCRSAEIAINESVRALRSLPPEEISSAFEQSLVAKLCRATPDQGF